MPLLVVTFNGYLPSGAAEAYLEPSRPTMKELFVKIVNCFRKKVPSKMLDLVQNMSLSLLCV